MTGDTPALENDVTKEKKKHGLDNSEKASVDARKSFEEDLKINTKLQPLFQIIRRPEVKLQEQSRLTLFSLVVSVLSV